MEGIRIYKKPKLQRPYLVCAWPGMGEVAFKAAMYLVEKLKAQDFAEIMPEDFFFSTGSIVVNGLLSSPQMPSSKFYYYKNKLGRNDLIIFISNAQPDLNKAGAYAQRIIRLAKSFDVKTVISFAAMPQAIEHTQEPKVWFSATDALLNNQLKKYNFNLLSDGQISGMNGLFLSLAKKQGLEGFCLLGEIPLYTIQIENPKASAAVLEALARILNLQIDFLGLIEQARLMSEEINKLLDYLKIGSQTSTPISDEDIQQMKKALSQLSKLPPSVKEKIEKLFTQVHGDISRANELKAVLDRWNVYKEYEDRFLDLFRKSKDKSN